MKMERSRRPALKTTSSFCWINGSASTCSWSLNEKGGMGPDHTSRQLLGLVTRREGDAVCLEVTFDAVKINPAITRDIGKAIYIFFAIQPDLHDDGLDGLLDPIAAQPGDNFRSSFLLMFDDAIRGAFSFQKITE